MSSTLLKPSQLAGVWSQSPHFAAFLQQQRPTGGTAAAPNAADFIRSTCGVASRKELDTDPAALKRFNDLIRQPFLAWRDRQSSE